MRRALVVALLLVATLAGASAPAAATHACEPGMYCGHGEEVGAVLCLAAEPLPDKVERLLCPWVSG